MTDVAMEAGTFRLADVFSKAFAIYRGRFAPFITLTIIASIPNFLVLFTIVPLMEDKDLATSGADVGLMLADGVTQMLSTGAVMHGVVQELRGRAFSAADSIRTSCAASCPCLASRSVSYSPSIWAWPC